MKELVLLLMVPFLSFGQCEGDCSNGQGTYTFSNDDSFDGEWKNGEIYKGLYKWEGGDSFDGEWKDGKKHKGLYKRKGKFSFDGEWKNGEIYKGLYKWEGGDSFDGEWKDGEIYTGLYKHKDKKTNITYENTYEKGVVICKNNNITNFYQPKDIIGTKEYTTIILEEKSTNCEHDIKTIVHSLELKISGQYIKFTFDTGAEGISIGLNQWEKLSLNPHEYIDLNIASKSTGIGGEVPSKYYKLNQLKIGDYIMKNVIISVIIEDDNDLDNKEFNNLLGMGLLSKFSNAKWDMKQNKLTLYK